MSGEGITRHRTRTASAEACPVDVSELMITNNDNDSDITNGCVSRSTSDVTAADSTGLWLWFSYTD